MEEKHRWVCVCDQLICETETEADKTQRTATCVSVTSHVSEMSIDVSMQRENGLTVVYPL